LHEITESTADHLNVERVSIWFFNESKSKIICDDLFLKTTQQHFQGDEIFATEFPVYFEAIKNVRVVAAKDATNNESTYEFGYNYLQRTGIVSMLDSPIRIKGEVSGVICIESIGEMRDWNLDEMNFAASISDFLSLAREMYVCKTLEVKAKESDSLKSAFIANLSYKLRTPINAISGFINLLPDKDLSEKELEHFINIINLNIQQLMHLVDDVIDISKIQTGQVKIQKTTVHLNSLFVEIKQAATELLDLHHKDNLHLILNLPEENFQMETDPDRLKQVFGYLIDNAIKFTNHGSIEIGYKLDTDKTLILFVKDTGIGIPAEKTGTVFIPFNQFDQYYIRKYEGTGLGLSISNGLVTLMQGTIWIESEYGVGTTFWIKLPLSQNHDEPESINVYPDDSDQEINWTGKKILIVEDVINNYELLETMLHRTRATIIWADTGEVALQFFNANPDLDLVLMDIKLPDIDGLELTRQMKANRPDLPIVAQTAFALSGDREKVLESGCDEYLAKPISRIKLLRVLSKFIK
jgi:signal transduction histidine kinase